MTTETETERALFHEWLAEYKGGALNEEITMAFADLVTEVEARGKGGSFSLTFKVSKNGERNVEVVESLVVKTPPVKRSSQIFFPDLNGGLFRDDPYQKPLFDKNS